MIINQVGGGGGDIEPIIVYPKITATVNTNSNTNRLNLTMGKPCTATLYTTVNGTKLYQIVDTYSGHTLYPETDSSADLFGYNAIPIYDSSSQNRNARTYQAPNSSDISSEVVPDTSGSSQNLYEAWAEDSYTDYESFEMKGTTGASRQSYEIIGASNAASYVPLSALEVSSVRCTGRFYLAFMISTSYFAKNLGYKWYSNVDSPFSEVGCKYVVIVEDGEIEKTWWEFVSTFNPSVSKIGDDSPLVRTSCRQPFMRYKDGTLEILASPRFFGSSVPANAYFSLASSITGLVQVYSLNKGQDYPERFISSMGVTINDQVYSVSKIYSKNGVYYSVSGSASNISYSGESVAFGFYNDNGTLKLAGYSSRWQKPSYVYIVEDATHITVVSSSGTTSTKTSSAIQNAATIYPVSGGSSLKDQLIAGTYNVDLNAGFNKQTDLI